MPSQLGPKRVLTPIVILPFVNLIMRMDQFKCGGSPVAGWAYSFGSVQGVTMLAEGGLK